MTQEVSFKNFSEFHVFFRTFSFFISKAFDTRLNHLFNFHGNDSTKFWVLSVKRVWNFLSTSARENISFADFNCQSYEFQLNVWYHANPLLSRAALYLTHYQKGIYCEWDKRQFLVLCNGRKKVCKWFLSPFVVPDAGEV